MKAIFVPQDPKKPMIEVEGPNIRAIAQAHTNIDWIEGVNTRRMHDHHFRMVVDDDGDNKSTHHRNIRAQIISLYPGAILGDVLLVGFDWTPGVTDFVSLPTGVMDLLETWEIQKIAGRGL